MAKRVEGPERAEVTGRTEGARGVEKTEGLERAGRTEVQERAERAEKTNGGKERKEGWEGTGTGVGREDSEDRGGSGE